MSRHTNIAVAILHSGCIEAFLLDIKETPFSRILGTYTCIPSTKPNNESTMSALVGIRATHSNSVSHKETRRLFQKLGFGVTSNTENPIYGSVIFCGAFDNDEKCYTDLTQKQWDLIKSNATCVVRESVTGIFAQ